MYLHFTVLAWLAVWPVAILGISTYHFSPEDIRQGIALKRLVNEATENIKGHRADGCRFEDAQVRKEWRELSQMERREFIEAVQCLQNIPTNLSDDLKEIYPGVKTRFDEFLATHIELVGFIHMTADFLAWHRFFIHSFEQDLKSKCQYTGSLPYWEWGFDAEDPQNSSLFNGDPYSMGSNGEFIPNREPAYWPSIKEYIPVGTGGGCVYEGPFSNSTVNMGPINAAGQQPVPYNFQYNPHCLERDLNPTVTRASITFQNTTDLILEYDTIDWFQAVMQKDPRFAMPSVPYGVHRGGHVGVGRVMGDAAGSPGDPMFYLHHAQIDRVWSTWQALDPEKRRYAIWGTHTLADNPPSANMTLDEMIDFRLVAEPVKFEDLMDTLSGPFCYYYT
ncbi:tyrosinase family protein [Aspergillus alliaceus]|uniref:tyrosinase family protein n=1 Tax=Petromyces alliaceus TaxID=209559 RepID=UPI0012A5E0BF|nr:uncharacterized protein BDW43DRAFT_324079 [Aspergillus alliaceus]KAB8227288.1 hypothetical protein BDW43DRAFT_324079 [Aspergillus alliaceus]